ncbi:hypothetical protein GQ53DRAFT_845514 [Thozetella sp. PMI_491]|nr:hypothetical protein GQ53DRAFT_845514 [Thozetella sp. PMI_491]
MQLYTVSIILTMVLASQAALARDPKIPTLRTELLDRPGSVSQFELAGSRRALLKLKDDLGPPAIAALLQADIESANAAWHSIVANSNSAAHILAQAHVKAIPSICDHRVNFTASAFLAWFANGEPGNENKNIAAHPEHYVELGSLNPDGTLRVDILEAWGPLITHYLLPHYAQLGTGTTTAPSWLKPLPGYPYQFVDQPILQDGSDLAIGYVHNSFRDSGCGVEALLAVWLPSAIPPEILESLQQHQAVEFTNWLTAAYEDIRTGAFVP